MIQKGEYTDAIYLYMSNERLIARTSGVSTERRKRLRENNRIIKKNINEIFKCDKFTELYEKISGDEWRDMDYTFMVSGKESTGESLMSDKLTELKLPYFQEVTFSLLPYLRFDFFLPSRNAVIEVDGIQHFAFTEEYHSSYNDFELQKKHDNAKRNFAYRNNMIYIRFRYNELNDIESKLRKNFIIK